MHTAKRGAGFARVLACLGLTLALLAGCAHQRDPTAGWSAQRLYDEAKQSMERADFQQAIEYFETLEARYPFGDLALQAQLDIAYSYYRYGENASAIAAADRFIKLHPTHEGAAYAHYLRGLVRYNQGNNLLGHFFPRNMANMDPSLLRQAFSDFQTVVREHPQSRYVDDARQRLVYLRNELAQHELNVARFYFDRSAYAAALNRVDYLLSHYDRAASVPDALALKIDAYRALDMPDLAEDARRVLARNWPEHSALADS
ncbi:MAG: outer membrane protein assembly factor BamD [Halofilum sp. (in: g-proteobacteria)]